MDYIFGYGSLISQYSRRHYSDIQSEVMTAQLKGWYRAWCVSYPDERATYAGALPNDTSLLDGVLIASEIDEGITQRERGYRFTAINVEDIRLDGAETIFTELDRIWICETLRTDIASTENPLPQSYVDTCISGCLEAKGVEGAIEFIQQTQGWDCVWINDRHLEHTPRYPRYTPVSGEQAILIDALLDQQGVLKFRNS
ncbi:MAG: hypothetical protein ACJAQ6_001688 [Arenicella sp.]|jgi:hypothetical protein